MEPLKNELLFLEINQKSHEVQLLTELAHELMNFQEGFKSTAKKTYILSPWASSLFGMEILNDKLYLGVPEFIYNILCRTRIYLVNYIRNTPGIFIVINAGNEPKCQPIAIRIYMRTSRIASLSLFKQMTFIKMNAQGEAIPGYNENEFVVDIKEVERLDWEQHNQKNTLQT